MKLYDWHVKGWLDLWSHGRIEIEGNLPIARAAAASLYNILTSLPEREDPLQSFIGLSPCGLSWGDEEVSSHLSFRDLAVHLILKENLG